jgi:hypothetical protein
MPSICTIAILLCGLTGAELTFRAADVLHVLQSSATEERLLGVVL